MSADAIGKICLWFFRDLSDEQRNTLFALFGIPTDEANTHGRQTKCLRHVIATIRGGRE